MKMMYGWVPSEFIASGEESRVFDSDSSKSLMHISAACGSKEAVPRSSRDLAARHLEQPVRHRGR